MWLEIKNISLNDKNGTDLGQYVFQVCILFTSKVESNLEE